MKLGMVVLNYNDAESTITFLNNIKDYKKIDKIVVVDNCSSDNSYSKLKELERDNVEVVQTEENRGYASGNNFGVKYLYENYAPEFTIVSNPDVLFDETVVDSLLECLNILPDAGVVGCRMNCLSSIELPIAWKLPRFRDCLIQDSYIIKKSLGIHWNINAKNLKRKFAR